MKLVNYYSLLFLLLPVGSLAHSFAAQQREDEHFDKDGKHNDEYDHKTFLGESQQKQFEQLSPEESIKRLGQLVDKIDKNKDGNISQSELADWIKYISLKESTEITKQTLQKCCSKAMKDDGLISWEELFSISFPGSTEDHSNEMKKRIKNKRARFQVADENKDDKLSLEEFVALNHPHLFPRMQDIIASEILETKDADKDGMVTLKDLLTDTQVSADEMKKKFEYRDSNHNGHLEKSEIQEWYFPTTYDINENEARHLIRRADADKNGNLAKKEILDNHEIFVSSQVTHWGASLKRSIDEL